MADDDNVNRKLTDAVTQTTVQVLGEAPAQSMALVYQIMATSVGTSMQNATSSQQAMQQIGAAVVSSACARILSANGAAPVGTIAPPVPAPPAPAEPGATAGTPEEDPFPRF